MENLPTPSNNPAPMTIDFQALLTSALTNNTPIETVRGLLDTIKDLQAQYAHRRYLEAKAAFQSECPIIGRNTHGPMKNDNKSHYDYAPYEHIYEVVQPYLAKYGLSYDFQSETLGDVEDGWIETYCILSHVDGYVYKPEKPVRFPIHEGAGNFMSRPQRVAWSITFSKRYALMEVLALATEKEDIDSPGKQVQSIASETIMELQALLPQTKFTEQYMFEVCKVQSFDQMTEAQGRRMITQLRRHVTPHADKPANPSQAYKKKMIETLAKEDK